MAVIRAQWRVLEKISVADKQASIEEWLEDISDSEVDRGVYVIRLSRPYTILYPNRRSPVLYIGEGNTRGRLRSHLSKWVTEFARIIPEMSIDARICQPRVQKNAEAYKEVEADLLSHFCQVYGAIPIFNRNKEYFGTPNEYTRKFLDVLNPGRGRGYKWALQPLGNDEPRFREYQPWRDVRVVSE